MKTKFYNDGHIAAICRARDIETIERIEIRASHMVTEIQRFNNEEAEMENELSELVQTLWVCSKLLADEISEL